MTIAILSVADIGVGSDRKRVARVDTGEVTTKTRAKVDAEGNPVLDDQGQLVAETYTEPIIIEVDYWPDLEQQWPVERLREYIAKEALLRLTQEKPATMARYKAAATAFLTNLKTYYNSQAAAKRKGPPSDVPAAEMIEARALKCSEELVKLAALTDPPAALIGEIAV